MGLWDTYRKPMVKMVFIGRLSEVPSNIPWWQLPISSTQEAGRAFGSMTSMPWKKTFQIHPTWKLLSSQNNSGSTAQLLFLLQQNKRFSKLEGQKSLLTYTADTMVGVLLITYWKKETQLVPPDQGPGTWPGTSVSRANQKQPIMTESEHNPDIIT